MREITTFGLLFTRKQKPNDGEHGLWFVRSLMVPPEHQEEKQVESETAQVLDRLAHLEDTLVHKEQEQRGDMAIDIGPSERMLLRAGIPLVIQNGKQNVTLTWSGEIDDPGLRGLLPG